MSSATPWATWTDEQIRSACEPFDAAPDDTVRLTTGDFAEIMRRWAAATSETEQLRVRCLTLVQTTNGALLRARWATAAATSELVAAEAYLRKLMPGDGPAKESK